MIPSPYLEHPDLVTLDAHPTLDRGVRTSRGSSSALLLLDGADGPLLVGGPVVVKDVKDLLDVVVGLQAGHELHLGRDGGRGELGGGDGLGSPAALHGVAEVGEG